MTIVKGKFESVEIAEDGSSIKIRIGGGHSAQVTTEDLKELIAQLLDAMVAGNLTKTARPNRLPNRFEKVPFSMKVDDINLNHHPDSGALSVEFSDRKGARMIANLTDAQLSFLLDVYQRTRTPPSAPSLH